MKCYSGIFKKAGFNIVNQPEDADVIVVNTCGFIESAKKEAIDTILEMADYKQNRCQCLIVTGCLAKRYKEELLEAMPEIDLCIGVDEYENIQQILSDYFNQEYLISKLDFHNRIISSQFPLAYVRISDGCDNRCSYCAIPLIRGNFKSRKMEDILMEVEELAKQGISEICLISQDTSKYGKDLYGTLKLPELLHQIGKIQGIKWIRILYLYLYETTDELIDEIANNKKVCHYFDIPIQHVSNKMLKAMNRHDTKELIYERIKQIREKVPDAILRTTVITGFPGETEDDFEELRQGILELQFDRLGAFAYSREEDTKAYHLTNQISEQIKQERLKEVFQIQKSVALESNKKRIGKQYEVIVEDISENEKYFICRSMFEAPDVDGRIYLPINEETTKEVIVGEYTIVKIVEYDEYDLYATLAKERS